MSSFKAIDTKGCIQNCARKKKNPDKRKACRGSHRVHRGWRRNTHTVPVM